ncbi:DUF3696 domain-containing protein [Gallaecimonas sp. GXIMD4217]|uniref:AAA family ATPase n=1 Tax=Gallaecimonas sp. GXIMD4217 TaxID=3131927 RepID=UPI00311AE65A
MITDFHIKNFKAWEDIKISLGKVTGIFGSNSSGKSSFIQFLLMLKQTKNNPDRNIVIDFGGVNKIVDLGTYYDVIFRHEEKRCLEWSFTWSFEEKIRVSDPMKSSKSTLFEGNKLSISCSTGFVNSLLEVKELSYNFDGNSFIIEREKEEGRDFNLVARGDNRGFRFVRTQGRSWKLPGPVKNYLYPDQAKTYFQNADFLSSFEASYEALMDKIYYLGPLREHPKRQYQWSGSSPEGVGYRGENAIDAILAATRKGETRNFGGRTHYKPFQEMIAHWLKEMGLIHSFEVKEIAPNTNLYRTLVRKEAGSAETALTDVGFGVSQVLPVLVLLYYVPKNSIVLLEQPEIHLHPSVQSHLADLILTVSKTRNVQIIVESHSEHFIRRLQRRIAEDQFECSDIELYFFSTHRGKAKYENLKINPYGSILNWPDNFFGDEMSEIAETRRASLIKQMRETDKND